MPISLKTLNRLRMGRDVAARLSPQRPADLAWVYVYPLLNPEEGTRVLGHGGEPQILKTGSGNPIAGFLIRHLEIERSAAEDYYNELRDEIGVPFRDERFVTRTEDDLERQLNSMLDHLSALHVPDDVGYTFEMGPDLLGEWTESQWLAMSDDLRP